MKNRVKLWIIFLLLFVGISQLSIHPIEASQQLAITEERLVVFEIFTRET